MTGESYVNEIKIVFFLPNANGLYKEKNFPWGKHYFWGFFSIFFFQHQPNKPSYQELGSVTLFGCDAGAAEEASS